MKRILLTLTFFISSIYFIGAETLTLDQARILALANSRSLAKYNLTIQTNRLTERSEFYDKLPKLSLTASTGLTFLNADGIVKEVTAETLNPSVNLGVSKEILFQGGKSLVQKAIDSIDAEVTRKEAQAVYYTVLDEVDSAYYSLLKAAASLESAESALRTVELSLSTAEVRSANGMMSPGDYLQAQYQKEVKENARNQAARTLLLEGVKMRNLTGLKEAPVPEAIDFAACEELIQRLAVLTDAEADALYTGLLKTVAVNNPALAKAILANQKAEKNVTLAKRDYSPSLTIGLSAGVGYSAVQGFAPTGKVTLSGNIPLDFWVKANNVAQKRVLQDQTALAYLDAEEELELNLQTALLGLISDAGTVLSSRRAFEYAEKHFAYVMELFRLSQNSVSDLSEASDQMSSNRNQLISSQYGFLLSLSKLRSLGAFADEDVLTGLLLSAGIR
jgi:outer membrane protein TolC